jgi:hypothetical protein
VQLQATTGSIRYRNHRDVEKWKSEAGGQEEKTNAWLENDHGIQERPVKGSKLLYSVRNYFAGGFKRSCRGCLTLSHCFMNGVACLYIVERMATTKPSTFSKPHIQL